MNIRCLLLIVILYSCNYVYCWGDVVMYPLSPEVTGMRADRQSFVSNQRIPQYRNMWANEQQAPQMQQNFKNSPQPEPKAKMDKQNHVSNAYTFNFTDFMNSINAREETEEQDNEMSRAAGYSYSQNPGYDYRQPLYAPIHTPFSQGLIPYTPNYFGYQDHQSYGPPLPAHLSVSKATPVKAEVIDLVKPVATKVAGKISGVIGLVLALLTGTSPNDVELKGFKEIVINGIVRPLLLAQGGIKSLFNKLTIPLISLFLINLEVLITMWWLWDDCPSHPPPPYVYPTLPLVKSYNPYR